jgi:hypothetical protein
MLGTSNESTILRLRVKGSNLDPLALRGRLENLLNEIPLDPRLPPSATLFIRKLSDPLPGLLQLDTTHPRAPQAWQHAFTARFEQLVTSAARPAYGLVADSAESVVFYDYSELLASLSADWCSGFVTTRWWWQSLIKRGDISQVIKQFWRDKIEYVPAALEHLVKRNLIVEFVSALSDDEARDLVQRLVHVFALHAIKRVLDLSQDKGARFSQPTASLTYFFDSPSPAASEIKLRSLMPWRHTVTESDTPRLTPQQQLFLGIGLMIQRAPTRVRTLSFAREVEQWQEPLISASTAHASASETIQSSSRSVPHSPVSLDVDEVVETTEAARDLVPDIPISVPDKPERERVKIGNAVFTQEEGVAVPETAADDSLNEASVLNEDSIVQNEPVFERAPQTFTSTSESLAAFTVETELGGLFYLINLGIFLELYSDFTSPVETFTELNIWDFVAIVGHELNGHEEHDDPIWSLLADLSGREDGHNLQDENHVNHVNHVNKPAWLDLPYLQARLRRALGINTEVDLGELVLRHHARVIVTPTHIDVYFALSELPIEIRLSGLDRNPGWVPAAGRFIAFHYD